MSGKQNERRERRKKGQRRSRNEKSDKTEKERKIGKRHRFEWPTIYVDACMFSIKIKI
jgi:hypothetical protein